LQALNVSGQLPGPETVANGAYPLVRPLTLYSSTEVLGGKPQAAAFINFYLRTARHLAGNLYFPPNQVDFGNSKATFIQAMGWAPEPTAEVPAATPAPISQGPSIGPITFAAGATDDNQPIGTGISFPEDIAEIHAIFSFAGMSETDVWERYWYQEGEEVGSGSGNWEAGESGTFDLSLSTDGEPLGSGDWELEIYVNGDLAQVGTFVIEAGPVAAPTATPTATPLPSAATYKLAFARWDGGKHNLYTANTAGGGERFIVERAAGPSWSSDGQALYVYGEEGVDQQIREGVTYTWPDAGISNGVLLLYLSAVGDGGLPNAFQHSSWKEGTGRAVDLAPNGGMLAYDATHGSPDRRIYFLGTDENQQFSIEIPGEQPSWSPDSSQVAYRSGRDNKTAIWISSRDDSVHYSITNEGSDAFPAWSPDGQSIAFHRDPGGNVDIYVANADGSNVRRLTDAPGPDTLPTWTPDGRIVFRSARSGSWGIYIMNGDGSGQKQIIANADPGPDWTFGKMDVY
jgi:hypothetical protein